LSKKYITNSSRKIFIEKYSQQISHRTDESQPSRAQAFNRFIFDQYYYRSNFSINISFDQCFQKYSSKFKIKGLLIAEIQTSLNGHVS